MTLSGTVAGEGPGTVDVRSSSIGNGSSISKGEPVGSVTLASAASRATSSSPTTAARRS